MRTHVVIRAKASILLAHDQDRFGTEIGDEIIPRLRRLVSNAADLPGAPPHALPLVVEVLARDKALGRDRVAAQLRLLDLVGPVRGRFHHSAHGDAPDYILRGGRLPPREP